MTGLAAVAAMAIVFAVPAVRHLREAGPPAPPEMRVEITTPDTDVPLQFALSPDGRFLVFVASSDGPSWLWLRPLDQTEARPLAGTEGARAPFWSPDGRAIAFIAAGRLFRIDIAGGAPHVLATPRGIESGGSWSADGTILLGQLNGSLMRVAPAGGELVAANSARPFGPNRSPLSALPAQRSPVSVLAAGTPESAGIYLGRSTAAPPRG